MQLKDRVAVVTGAARGNGRAISERFAAEGACVVCGDRHEDELVRTVEAIRAAGGRAEAVRCDVTDPDEVEAMVALAERLGGPQAVVAQAGVDFSATIVNTTPEEWDRVMGVDAKGVFLTARAAIPRMQKLGGGAIVAMSGTMAWFAEPGSGLHCAAKAAVFGLTRAMALECAPYGIRCNTIAPGYIETPMVSEWLATAPDGEEVRRALTRQHPLGRFARPDEIAALALFLCSDESAFCTGQQFVIDGGLTAGFSVVNNRDEFQKPR